MQITIETRTSVASYGKFNSAWCMLKADSDNEKYDYFKDWVRLSPTELLEIHKAQIVFSTVPLEAIQSNDWDYELMKWKV